MNYNYCNLAWGYNLSAPSTKLSKFPSSLAVTLVGLFSLTWWCEPNTPEESWAFGDHASQARVAARVQLQLGGGVPRCTCGRKSISQNVHILISGSCEHVTLLGKRDCIVMVKIKGFGWGKDPGLFWWAQSNHESLKISQLWSETSECEKDSGGSEMWGDLVQGPGRGI